MQPSRASRLTVDQQAQRLLHGQPLCRDGALLRLSALLGCAVIIVGNWLATMRHEGLVNGAYQMAPVGELRSAAREFPPPVQLIVGQGVAMQWRASAPSARTVPPALTMHALLAPAGNFIVAVMGPLLDPGYFEVKRPRVKSCCTGSVAASRKQCWRDPSRTSATSSGVPTPPHHSPAWLPCCAGLFSVVWIRHDHVDHVVRLHLPAHGEQNVSMLTSAAARAGSPSPRGQSFLPRPPLADPLPAGER